MDLHVSAKTGDGVDKLIESIEGFMIKDYMICNITVDASEGKLLSLLKANAEVVNTSIEETKMHLVLFMDKKFYGRLKKYHPDLLDA